MKKKQQPKQQGCLTPKTKITIQPIVSPNSNSNSFSQIFQTFYPRTPVRKVNQQKKDQLGQVMEKGISSFAIATQVTFNSTTQFKHIQNQDHFTQFHVYDKRNKIQDSDWSLLNYKSSQSYTNKTQLFYTLTSVFRHYKQNKDSFFMISNAQFLAFYSYSKDDIPYCLFISRQDNTSKSQSLKSQFLEQKQIESIVLGVDTPQSVLFPASQTQFPTKYTLSLVQKKHLVYLFNFLLNIALEKELMDIAANFSFHNSYSHSIQTYNGIDQIEQETMNLFENTTEFKIQFEGLFNVEQIINLKNKLQKSNTDIVVSDIKLNPISTLISKNLLERINNELK